MLKIESLNMFKCDKILDVLVAAEKVAEIKACGKTVGLCHGGFDLLHPGHILHFVSAKRLCDYLFVSITSDYFINKLKGEGRPIFSDKLRAYFAANISCVDYVVISEFEKGVEVINLLKPSYYIKGSDQINKTRKENPVLFEEIDAISSLGGEIKFTLDEKLSTTEIIDYIRKF